MWPINAETPTFNALPYRDKRRVTWCLMRGEAPRDPQMAAAAIELAEAYQRKGRGWTAWMRWAPTLAAISFACFAISEGIDGEPLGLIVGAIGFVTQATFAANPTLRPKSMVRSLEASRRAIASGVLR
jgi:hypothetical protein